MRMLCAARISRLAFHFVQPVSIRPVVDIIGGYGFQDVLFSKVVTLSGNIQGKDGHRNA